MLPASRLFADVVTLQPGPEGTDAFVAQMNGGMNFGSNTALASGLGPDFGGGEKRAFLQFSLASIPTGATINSATLSLYVSQAAGGAQTASAYKVTSTWDESAVNWNNQPSSDATAISSVAVNSTGWKSWTITSLVSSWCNGSVTNNGVLVKQSSGSPPNNVQFHSSDFGGDPTLRPKLVVDYTTVNNPPTAVSLNAPTNVTDTTISLSWSQNADADFQSYKLYRSTSAGVTEQSTLVTTVTQQTSTTYTDTGLTPATAFCYRVFVVDTGALSSGGSNEVSATTASPPPPPPSVANLSVAATPTSIVADGAAHSTITATLTDVNNQPVADHAVNFTTSSGTLSAASATTNAQGNASVTLTSGTTAGTAQITSTSSGLTGTCSVTLTAVPPPPATVSVAVTPTLITADGVSTGTVTSNVTVDGQQPAPDGTTVTFTTTWGSFQGADPATPQSLQATTVNSVATVVVVSSNTMSANSTFTVTASALGAQGTATPQTQQSSTNSSWLDILAPSGTIGGGKFIRVKVAPPQGYRFKELTKAQVTEIITTDPPPHGLKYDDLTGAGWEGGTAPGPGQTGYLSIYWDTGHPGHNGTHRINIEADFEAMMGGQVQHAIAAPVEVNIQNLQVATFTPKYLKWFGEGNLDNETTISYQLTDAPSDEPDSTLITYVQVTIHDVSGGVVREYFDTFVGSQTTQPHTVPWDGRTTGSPPPGPFASAGIYPYEIHTWHTAAALSAEDTKCSTALQITASADKASFKPHLGEKVTITYALNTDANPGSVSLKILKSDATALTALPLTDPAPNAAGVHTVEWDGKMNGQSVTPDLYTFMVEAEDNNLSYDRSHRRKWAREMGGKISIPLRVKYAKGTPGGIGYVAVPAFTGDVQISFDVEDKHQVEGTVEIFAADGVTLIHSVPVTPVVAAANISVTWNAKDDSGNRVEPGLYPVKVTVHDWAGNPLGQAHASSDNSITEWFDVDTDYHVHVPSPLIPCATGPENAEYRNLGFRYSLKLKSSWGNTGLAGTPFQGVHINVHDSEGGQKVNLGGDLGYWTEGNTPPSTPLNDLSLDNQYNNIQALIEPDDYGHVVVGFDNWGKNTMAKVGKALVPMKPKIEVDGDYLPQPGTTSTVVVKLLCRLCDVPGHPIHSATRWIRPVRVLVAPSFLKGVCSNYDENPDPVLNQAADMWWSDLPDKRLRWPLDLEYLPYWSRHYYRAEDPTAPADTYDYSSGQITFGLKSYDYGGRAEILVSGLGEPDPATEQAHGWLPKDSDEDTLPDKWEILHGLNPNSLPNEGEADEDNDSLPAGANLGDGITVFDEYRGFYELNAPTPPHTRLDPRKKEVFIRNPHALDISYFTGNGLVAHIIDDNMWQGDSQAQSLLSGVVNFNGGGNQWGILLADADQVDAVGGSTPLEPNQPGITVGNPGGIYANSPHSLPGPVRCFVRPSAAYVCGPSSAWFKKVIAHELGHAVGMNNGCNWLYILPDRPRGWSIMTQTDPELLKGPDGAWGFAGHDDDGNGVVDDESEWAQPRDPITHLPLSDDCKCDYGSPPSTYDGESLAEMRLR